MWLVNITYLVKQMQWTLGNDYSLWSYWLQYKNNIWQFCMLSKFDNNVEIIFKHNL